jgi:hypothetical protein
LRNACSGKLSGSVPAREPVDRHVYASVDLHVPSGVVAGESVRLIDRR